MTFEKFQNRVAAASDDTDLDQACIAWLRSVANDQGKEGAIANALLTQVKVLLEIY